MSENNDDFLQEFAKASKENIEEYTGLTRSTANRGRTFLTDVETNVGMRSDYNRADWEYYRESERTDVNKIDIANRAYESVGIVYSTINLMADFTVQGIRVVHEDPKIQKFYRSLWKKWDADSFSERFCNQMYRLANVPVNIHSGTLSKKAEKEMKAQGIKCDFSGPKVKKRHFPCKFNLLYPNALKAIDADFSTITGKYRYGLKISSSFIRTFNQGMRDAHRRGVIESTIPEDLVKFIKNRKSRNGVYPLPEDKLEVYFYKKDDWKIWSLPMVYPIIEDLQLLQAFKLADRSALDGAISNIRLWTLGNFDAKVAPSKRGVQKLSQILKSTNPGTLDLVWGPELTFKESNTNVHQFLGPEKYQQVMRDIYQGLGIPPSLTGAGGASGGANTANGGSVSMKTLIERLEYGRRQLITFWDKQLEKVQKAMGHAKRAKIIFDYKVLSDDASEKKLLMDLYDRGIVSLESLVERYGFDHEIEMARNKREARLRKIGKLPPKASPYHMAEENRDHDLMKIILQQGGVAPSEVGVELEERKAGEETHQERTAKIAEDAAKLGFEHSNTEKNVNPEGRPKNTKDKTQRKEKTVKVDTTKASCEWVDNFLWACEAQKQIHDVIFPAFLEVKGKKNARALTKKEASELEDMKFKTLCGMSPFDNISAELVSNKLESNYIDEESMEMCNILTYSFNAKNGKMPTLEEQKQIQASAYALKFEEVEYE